MSHLMRRHELIAGRRQWQHLNPQRNSICLPSKCHGFLLASRTPNITCSAPHRDKVFMNNPGYFCGQQFNYLALPSRLGMDLIYPQMVRFLAIERTKPELTIEFAILVRHRHFGQVIESTIIFEAAVCRLYSSAANVYRY